MWCADETDGVGKTGYTTTNVLTRYQMSQRYRKHLNYRATAAGFASVSEPEKYKSVMSERHHF